VVVEPVEGLVEAGEAADLVGQVQDVERDDDGLGAVLPQVRVVGADRAGDELMDQGGLPRPGTPGGQPLGTADVGRDGRQDPGEGSREVDRAGLLHRLPAGVGVRTARPGEAGQSGDRVAAGAIDRLWG
jgi:hypothetical protein